MHILAAKLAVPIGRVKGPTASRAQWRIGNASQFVPLIAKFKLKLAKSSAMRDSVSTENGHSSVKVGAPKRTPRGSGSRTRSTDGTCNIVSAEIRARQGQAVQMRHQLWTTRKQATGALLEKQI